MFTPLHLAGAPCHNARSGQQEAVAKSHIYVLYRMKQHGDYPEPKNAAARSASQLGPILPGECRAARIGDATEFAECLVKTNRPCHHRFSFNDYHYCVSPERETIIARTLAAAAEPE